MDDIYVWYGTNDECANENGVVMVNDNDGDGSAYELFRCNTGWIAIREIIRLKRMILLTMTWRIY